MSERRRQPAAQGWPIAARLRKLVFLCWAMIAVCSFIALWSPRVLSKDVAALASIAVALLALLLMLIMGRRVARSISQPLTELRDTVVRQREGEPGARAREDQGSSELRSVAADFNALSDQNLALQEIQVHALGTHQIAYEIAGAIRATSGTQEALDIVCAALGQGLGVDRVVVDTEILDRGLLLASQWHRRDLPPLEDLILLPSPGALAEELSQSTGFRAQEDLLDGDEESREIGRILCRKTGAQAVIMVPIGLQQRVMGVIYVLGVHEPRFWSVSEINLVQAVAGLLARAIVEVEHEVNQREYVERVEELDRQKSDFLANVSHELRTPLTSISGYLELIEDGDAGELTERQREVLEVIHRNATRLQRLVEDVILLSRAQVGATGTDLAEVSVPAVIARVVDELRPIAEENAIKLEVDAGPEAAVVLGDATALDGAAVNILSNAIKFSRRGGFVAFSCTLDQDARRVLITCQDRGIGIPAENQAELFTRFFRASNATDQAIPGTGLGLSIAKQIIEDDHGGELRLTSVEDEGTTVVIDLPLCEPLRPAEAVGNDSHSEDVFGIGA